MDDAMRATAATGLTEREGQAESVTSPTALEDPHFEVPTATGSQQYIDDVVDAIGPKVWSLRIRNGLTLRQLAGHSDVSAAIIRRIEHNRMVPTVTTLLKIATALHCRLSYFTEEDKSEAGGTAAR
jgi:ribosome-binding protein aMBF1 (putative translation factor)